MIILYYIHAGYDVHTYVVTLGCMILFMNMLLGTPKRMRLSDLYLGVLVLGLRDRP